jgi:hypothetical protein
MLVTPRAIEEKLFLVARRPNGHTGDAKLAVAAISAWIKAKINNSLVMIGLIQYANDIQKGVFAKYKPDSTKNSIERRFWNEGAAKEFFGEVDRWQSKVLAEIGTIIQRSIASEFVTEKQVIELLGEKTKPTVCAPDRV